MMDHATGHIYPSCTAGDQQSFSVDSKTSVTCIKSHQTRSGTHRTTTTIPKQELPPWRIWVGNQVSGTLHTYRPKHTKGMVLEAYRQNPVIFQASTRSTRNETQFNGFLIDAHSRPNLETRHNHAHYAAALHTSCACACNNDARALATPTTRCRLRPAFSCDAHMATCSHRHPPGVQHGLG